MDETTQEHGEMTKEDEPVMEPDAHVIEEDDTEKDSDADDEEEKDEEDLFAEEVEEEF